MEWTVTFLSGDDKLSLRGTENFDCKRDAVAAVYGRGTPRSITRVGRDYTVVVRDRR
jgi:hypothetical protein